MVSAETLQTQIQNKGTLGRLNTAKVPHQLGGALGDEGALDAEALGVGDAVIAVIGSAQAGELVGILGPVELAGIHNDAADGGGVAVHVLGGGVGDDIRAPLKGTAVDGSGEGVVHDQGHTVLMGDFRKLLNVQHRQGGVGDGLAEERPGVGLEGGVQLFRRRVRGHEGRGDAHLRQRHADEVEGAAVDGGGGHDVVAGVADVEDGEEVGRLTGRGQHGRRAALQGRQLGRDIIVGGVLETGVEIAGGLQVKELAHVLGGGVLEGGGLHDGEIAGFPVFGAVARVEAVGGDTVITHG